MFSLSPEHSTAFFLKTIDFVQGQCLFQNIDHFLNSHFIICIYDHLDCLYN